MGLGLVVEVGVGVDGGSCGAVVVMDNIYLSLDYFNPQISNEYKK